MQNRDKHGYQPPQHSGWSRIAMLTKLYEAAHHATQQAAQALSEDPVSAGTHQVKAIALVHAIESGLDLNQGEIPQRIQQLCHFVEQCLLSADVERTESAARIMRQLADGFAAIHSEAHRLELDGEIPPLQLLPALDTLA